DSACVDTSSDVAACGACGVVCAASETCCDSACVDTSSDEANCGSCGRSCGASRTCCSGGCSDLSSDASHCGSCGTSCGGSEICSSTDPRGTGPVCECNVGTSCTTSADCASGLDCVTPVDTSVQPMPLAGGGYANVVFPGGYCMTGLFTSGSTCDPTDPSACGACASCQLMKDSPPIYVCLEDCRVSPFDNGGCRPGYQCDPVSGSCRTGCSSNVDCNRVRLADGRVTIISGGTGVCNPATARCAHPAGPSSSTGDACSNDFECPSNEQCLFSNSAVSFPGGYCTRAECEVPGFACPGGDICTSRNAAGDLDGARCLRACTFLGEIADASLRLGVNGHGVGCRAGYACMWDGAGVVGAPGSGSCMPGNYNARASNNVGAACSSDGECYSPFGHGRCFGQPGRPHFCTVVDCSVLEASTSVCGAGACAPLSADVDGCAKTCTTANNCLPGQGCVVGGGGRVCVNFCRGSLDCRSGQTCSIPTGETTGTCI
ncbi:MAG: hypothetical protein GXP55_13730, partial [Deltaproteobacteria bacterium]|nr:hypothetical protein [Deltaproteobacteria bacterium]